MMEYSRCRPAINRAPISIVKYANDGAAFCENRGGELELSCSPNNIGIKRFKVPNWHLRRAKGKTPKISDVNWSVIKQKLD